MDIINFIGILFEGYSPLGAPSRPAALLGSPDSPVVMEDPVIQEIAKKHQISPAQVNSI